MKSLTAYITEGLKTAEKELSVIENNTESEEKVSKSDELGTHDVVSLGVAKSTEDV